MIDEHTTLLWRQYVAGERGQPSDASLAALERFITALLERNEETWQAWACAFAAQVSEGRLPVPVPIRMPLFERVLVPALSTAVLEGHAGSARTLASFGHLVHQAPPGSLPEGMSTPQQLLREALRVDPTDRLARTRLVDIIAAGLQYSLHELPAGVLWDANSASAANCDELLADLEDFRTHVAALGWEAEFADLTARCALHFSAYRDYLLHGRPAGSYERFLSTR